ncbi:hypothetical protein HNP68_000973 [Borrelia yangtzensis]|uniref:Variable large protein n=1 Tax=Borreliella yangtzensis TaxID=683292 RepID=A0ABR6PAW3_9SPIR|nr:hypothetical protein [Borreliella yangtzensis]
MKNADHADHQGTVKNAKAARAAGDAADGATAIGDVVEAEANKAATGGEAASANGIAKGIKGIVVAAAKGNGTGVGDVKDAENPIDAAIGSTGDADAAAAAFTKAEMKKNDQIAAAMVLRGMAKGGQFALKSDDHTNHQGTVKNEKAARAAEAAADGGAGAIGDVVKAENNKAAAKGGDEKSVNGIAKGIKGIVDAAEKAGDEGKLKADAAAGNVNAGKLFANKKKEDADANNGGGDDKDAGKAAAAVSKVSGEQILKAIVDAANGDGAVVDDVKDAENPIAATIGSTAEQNNAAAFAKEAMKKDDQIAASLTSFIVFFLILLLYILFSFI